MLRCSIICLFLEVKMEKGHEKIQKICEALRNETLEPSLREAETIISEAKKKAEGIIQESEKKAEDLIKMAKEEILREQLIFQGALKASAKQAVEMLRQDIEKRLFEPCLEKHLCKELAK